MKPISPLLLAFFFTVAVASASSLFSQAVAGTPSEGRYGGPYNGRIGAPLLSTHPQRLSDFDASGSLGELLMASA